MPRLTLAPTLDVAEETGFVRGAASSGSDMNKDEIQAEIDNILQACSTIRNMEPDEVMLNCSGYLARLTELYIKIQRCELVRRDLKSVRTQEIVPTMDLIRDQYKIASRLITVRGLDQDLAR